MDINIDFFACSQSFLVSFSSLFSHIARNAPSKKTKNLLKNHLITLAKSNDRFGLKGRGIHGKYAEAGTGEALSLGL